LSKALSASEAPQTRAFKPETREPVSKTGTEPSEGEYKLIYKAT